jgi:hypothetical protein
MSAPEPATVPSRAAIHDAAIAISRLLREARVDAPLRVKAVAALLVAAADAASSAPPLSLARLNRAVGQAVDKLPLAPATRQKLRAALRLDAHFAGVVPHLRRITELLAPLNLPAAVRRGCDSFSVFYEAFLRHGYDNNALGIVFTPGHIARFCARLIGVGPQDRVIDLACGTGGFLVVARELARQSATPPCPPPARLSSAAAGPTLAGCETNPTVWALAVLNTLAATPAGSDIRLANCFAPASRAALRGRFTRAFLNPPFSQGSEPERDFVDATMDALAPGGRCAVLVKAGIFADEEHAVWRARFLHRHTVLGVVGVPDDVFYPTAAPAAILLAAAHAPQPAAAPVMMARVADDGFQKLKNQRVECGAGDLPEVLRCFAATLAGQPFRSPVASLVTGGQLQQGSEWSPHEWLPQPAAEAADAAGEQRAALAAVLRAVADKPALAAAVLDDFAAEWQGLPALPLGRSARLGDFFAIVNGRSRGERHYRDGGLPYVSSGGLSNSIVRLVEADAAEVFSRGGITITAFGQAAVQPWPFAARGNGGSSVRVLAPKFAMGEAELLWFAAQINAQSWRFFYARMAIQSRIERLTVSSPPHTLSPLATGIATRVRALKANLMSLCDL